MALIAASCSAGFSRPRAQTVVEGEDVVYALVDPDANRNTETTIASLQSTIDGREWRPVVSDGSLPDRVGVELNQAGVAQECDEPTSSCYRVVSPGGGILLEESRDAGATWAEVWSISAGRLDFQNRCCGTRNFAIRDLEYVPETGLVAVALSEYGLLTLGTDAEIRLDTLGRPPRPESGFLVGLYIEPLIAGVLALLLGWVTTEQRLSRLRNELEIRFGSDDHTWLTDRARQVPILLPGAFFVGVGAVIAAIARVSQSANRDPPQANGWVTVTLAIVFIALVSGIGLWLHRRQWNADEETQARAHFAAARRKSLRALTVGSLNTVLTFLAALIPLSAWSSGGIDAFTDALKLSLASSAAIAAGFWIWEASHPPLPE